MLPKVSIEALNELSANTMVAHLGITLTEVGDDYLVATMPVDHRTHQPMGLLHGGASAALAETLGSVGSSMLVDLTTHAVTGLEINANHIRSVRKGLVTGKATLLHQGRSTHVWNINITDEAGKLVCVSRLTVMIIPLQR
jgi:uncharacterized protein (TIGR00369 family)